MSTLKVNAIEPYSGGTVTITGASIASASYAETANTLTAGDKTINGRLDATATIKSEYRLQVDNPLTTPNYLMLAQDSGSAKFSVVNDAGIGALGANVIVDGTSLFNGNAEINGNENLNGNLVQDQAGTNAVLLLQNPAFYSEYWGNTLQWFPNSGLGGNAILTVAEKAEAALQANSFPADFSYDHVVTIKANANGAQFADWDLPSYGDNIWLQIPDQGTPAFKRGLDVEGGQLTVFGTNDTPGTTLTVRDGVGPAKLMVQNAALKAITGIDVVVSGEVLMDGGVQLPGLGDYVDDAAAATGGVPVNGVYRTGSTLKIRVS